MLARLGVIALLLVSLAACGGSSALAGTWALSSVTGAAGITLPTGGRIDITFTSDGKVSGQGLCNSYSGSYTVTGQTIVFSPLASTQKACAAPLMTVDTAYFAALQATTSWQVSGSSLTLTGPAGRISLVYTNNQG